MVISRSKITSKRQITIPVKVMSRLKLHPGDSLVFEEKNGHVEVKNISEEFTIEDFVKKHHKIIHKKSSTEEIRKAREEFWGDPDK